MQPIQRQMVSSFFRKPITSSLSERSSSNNNSARSDNHNDNNNSSSSSGHSSKQPRPVLHPPRIGPMPLPLLPPLNARPRLPLVIATSGLGRARGRHRPAVEDVGRGARI